MAALLVSACGGDHKNGASAKTEAPKTEAAEAGQGRAVAPAAGGEATEKVKVVEGPAPGSEDRYALDIQAPAEAKAGEESKVTVRVVPKAPWHMNLEYPTSLQIDAPAGVEVAKTALKKDDAAQMDENAAAFDVAFTPTEAGERTFTGQFKFAVCQDEACSPVTEDVEFVVAVK